MASEEQEAVSINGVRTILQWEIHLLRLLTKYVTGEREIN